MGYYYSIFVWPQKVVAIYTQIHFIHCMCTFPSRYGDITPKTTLEKWVAVVCMLWGVLLFGYILGELASMLTNADAQRTRYINRLNVIKEQLYDYKVSHALKKKVVSYYEYLVRPFWARDGLCKILTLIIM